MDSTPTHLLVKLCKCLVYQEESTFSDDTKNRTSEIRGNYLLEIEISTLKVRIEGRHLDNNSLFFFGSMQVAFEKQ